MPTSGPNLTEEDAPVLSVETLRGGMSAADGLDANHVAAVGTQDLPGDTGGRGRGEEDG